jgi:ferric-dicitrate binding protein FerR (iron transport regulator)
VDKTPAQRDILTADERRARIIAQLKGQVGAIAHDPQTPKQPTVSKIDRRPPYRRAAAWLFAAASMVWVLVCIFVLSYLFAKAL